MLVLLWGWFAFGEKGRERSVEEAVDARLHCDFLLGDITNDGARMTIHGLELTNVISFSS
jgi:hypothetical protein